jgi:Ser-tRNA(Ala) deacylase AlaX
MNDTSETQKHKNVKKKLLKILKKSQKKKIVQNKDEHGTKKTEFVFYQMHNNMELKIDLPQRYAKMRAHTATHLLHAQLAKIFPNTKQA